MLRSRASRSLSPFAASICTLSLSVALLPAAGMAQEPDTLSEVEIMRNELDALADIVMFVLEAECLVEEDVYQDQASRLEALYDCLEESRRASIGETGSTGEAQCMILVDDTCFLWSTEDIETEAECLEREEAQLKIPIDEDRALMIPAWAAEAAGYKDWRDTHLALCLERPAGEHRTECEEYYRNAYQSMMDNHEQRKGQWEESLQQMERDNEQFAREACGVS